MRKIVYAIATIAVLLVLIIIVAANDADKRFNAKIPTIEAQPMGYGPEDDIFVSGIIEVNGTVAVGSGSGDNFADNTSRVYAADEGSDR